MKKIRVFFAASALLLISAGVFATKGKFFAAPPNLYYLSTSNGYIELATGDLQSALSEGGTNAEIVSGTTSTEYSLYYYNAGWHAVSTVF